ncbi:MAG: metallophosphoesterase family protein [Candidatus Promineifilaceae bacterium]|nr:metallophosphoesterase family protein [Candidatus Promineifilaceae bacterium]
MARLLIISDIHANLAAFEAVLEDASGEWDEIWCLGDIVGYGPDPNECAALLREHDHISLSGNHDWAVLGRLDISAFNSEAQNAIRWTQQTITAETRAYLERLPATLVEAPFTLAHASPRQPVWEYILDRSTASLNFAHFDTRFCLVGHTHAPVIFKEVDEGHVKTYQPQYSTPTPLGGNRLIINPGSVGQPRDSDPRAAYALLDTEQMTWEHRRVAYRVAATQERMASLGLPRRLVARLEHGW